MSLRPRAKCRLTAQICPFQPHNALQAPQCLDGGAETLTAARQHVALPPKSEHEMVLPRRQRLLIGKPALASSRDGAGPPPARATRFTVASRLIHGLGMQLRTLNAAQPFVVGTAERHAAALPSNPARPRSCWLLSQSEPNRSRVKIFSRTSAISAVMRLAMMTSHSCLKAPRSLMTFEPKNSVSCIAGS